ncbi:hypothetical protein A9W96_25835 [Mycobacterium sp. 1245852.3]|nr:hypothetical protein A9W96_25835 [Mycobacterium sp. 1245852.3]
MIVARIGGNGVDDHPQWGVWRRIGFYQDGELRLPTSSFEVYHQRPCNFADQLWSIIELNQRQCKVDARGDTGGRIHVAVADEDRIGFDGDIWEGTG